MAPIDDHPHRYQLANELHARPFPRLSCPSMAVFVAIMPVENASGRDRSLDLDHLVALLDRHGAPHPQPGATHYSGQIGRHVLKWEQHAEFVTYTVFLDGLGARPFDPQDFAVFPEDWLADAPGRRITSAHLRVCPMPVGRELDTQLADWFVPESVAISSVLDGAAVIAADFRIDPAGHQRLAIFVDPATGDRRIGRIVQRLLEIETYKSMSMLGFLQARTLSGRIADLDQRLSALMARLGVDEDSPDQALDQLLAISTEVEGMAARNSFRFGATGAYEAIVNQRIAALRETRFGGRQTFAEFMMRRYEPAMRTVKAVERQLHVLSDRATRAGDLLRTRVDVERSAQSQALLESMDRRADAALRLQHTVEGLSVVAVSYYAVSLMSYLLYPLTGPLGISKGLLTAMVTLPVVGLVWLSVRRIRRSID